MRNDQAGFLDMARAVEWRDENPSAYAYMESLAVGEARARRKVSARWLVEQARKKDFTSVYGNTTRINNNLTPAIARLIALDHPETREWFEFRHAKADGDHGQR